MHVPLYMYMGVRVCVHACARVRMESQKKLDSSGIMNVRQVKKLQNSLRTRKRTQS